MILTTVAYVHPAESLGNMTLAFSNRHRIYIVFFLRLFSCTDYDIQLLLSKALGNMPRYSRIRLVEGAVVTMRSLTVDPS